MRLMEREGVCVCLMEREGVCVCVDGSRSGRASFLWSDDPENLLTLLFPLKQQLLLLQCECLRDQEEREGETKRGERKDTTLFTSGIHSVRTLGSETTSCLKELLVMDGAFRAREHLRTH